MFCNEPEHLNPTLLSESENLGDDSLSGYDRDSEGGDAWDEIDNDESDSETRGTRVPPGVMGLKFQLDAARAGEPHHFSMQFVVNVEC